MVLSTKVQFNPSTLKVNYNSDTVKIGGLPAEVPDNCEHCLSTPGQIQVTFVNVASGGCLFVGIDPDEWINFDASTLSDINTTWVVNQKVGTSCTWETEFLDSVNVDYYLNEIPTCQTQWANTLADLKIIVDVAGGTIDMLISLDLPVAGQIPYSFIFQGILNPDSGFCLQETGIVNTNTTAGYARSGTANITEN